MRKFYAVVNDLIGGWDVSMHDKPVSEHVTSEGGPRAWEDTTIGSFMDKGTATAVARSLNLMQYCACGDDEKEYMHRANEHGSWPY